MAKTFKPGQLITIDNVVYQVRKTKPGYFVCADCAIKLLARDTYKQLERKTKICFKLCGIGSMLGTKRIPIYCHLKQVAP